MVPFGNFGWNFGFGFGWILVVLTVVLIALGVLQLGRLMARDREQEQQQNICRETPLDSLKRRYARGEISKEEFERKRTDIEVPAQEQKRAA